ncbi:uncharacterized protein LOC115385254 [Salarias fasciatus]|uniref:uncharacterized protein LOC115385254 n=1 Tax=Salarias fasciatus TaxID=181472 RepID=UPI001176F03B|nr:uncharacterized protein LOC115385254 [Salarias fasciatus]
MAPLEDDRETGTADESSRVGPRPPAGPARPAQGPVQDPTGPGKAGGGENPGTLQQEPRTETPEDEQPDQDVWLDAEEDLDPPAAPGPRTPEPGPEASPDLQAGAGRVQKTEQGTESDEDGDGDEDEDGDEDDFSIAPEHLQVAKETS